MKLLLQTPSRRYTLKTLHTRRSEVFMDLPFLRDGVMFRVCVLQEPEVVLTELSAGQAGSPAGAAFSGGTSSLDISDWLRLS